MKKLVVRVARRRTKIVPPLQERADLIYRRLNKEYPDAHCELDHSSPLQLLMATILSAQCTDKRVNLVTPDLFRKYPDANALADADPDEVEDLIRTTGFFRNKTKSLLGMAKAVVERHGGEIPDTMAELTKLPGVGRKTANVILGNAFGVNEGVVVDTHVGRLSLRLGLTRQTDPVKVEIRLMKLFPKKAWAKLSHLLIFHGRRVCVARAPRCDVCILSDICPSSRV
jgi:endonuclease-3